MKQQAILYKEYLDWVAKENKPGYKEWSKDLKKHTIDVGAEHDEYQKRLKAHMLSQKKKDNKWKSRGFLYKMFHDHPVPDFMSYSLRFPKDYSYLIPLPYYFPKERASQSGFMKWLVEKKYKLKK